jgi:hypothetical protein
MREYEYLILGFMIRFCPDSAKWKDRSAFLAQVKDMIPKDRPLKPVKTDTRPFGVHDVNEGSHKGIIEMLESLKDRSTLSEEEWSGKVKIIVGDWLTSNNIRGARKHRTVDFNTMERVEYVEELSALWHFALQATHMLMRGHLGNETADPGSLSAHKTLLGRKWDVNKPNYAAAKSLIQHSLIARIMALLM